MLGTWGGARNFAFTREEEALIGLVLLLQVRQHPLLRIQDYVDVLRSFGIETNCSYVKRYFKSLGLSHKKLRLRAVSNTLVTLNGNCFVFHKRAYVWNVQAAKFTVRNTLYYCHFMYELSFIPWIKLKFMDETGVQAGDVNPQYGWSEVGRDIEWKSYVPDAPHRTWNLFAVSAPSSDCPLPLPS
ncbi:MAG TPA: hypothetical protein V6C97_21340, partial [Oculatellaceae cyanobacterium]